MGTDIWMYAEVKGDNGWQLIGGLEKNIEHMVDTEEITPAYKPVEIFDPTIRNYGLFAILANVRNPDLSDEEPYEYIAPARGLPADLSPEVAEWASYWEDNEERNYGWLSLQELLAFDWHGKSMRKRGMVSRKAAHLFKGGKGSFPFKMWPAGEPISVSAWQLDGVSVRWIETYAESAGSDFMQGVIQRLETYGPPEQVRIVFWFN